jgi:hypothetical protein
MNNMMKLGVAIFLLAAIGCGSPDGTGAAPDGETGACCWVVDYRNQWVERCNGADVGEIPEITKNADASGRTVCKF